MTDWSKVERLNTLLCSPCCRQQLRACRETDSLECSQCGNSYSVLPILDGCPDLFERTTIFPHREDTAALIGAHVEQDDWGTPVRVREGEHSFQAQKRTELKEQGDERQLSVSQLYHDYTKSLIREEIKTYLRAAPDPAGVSIVELGCDNGRMLPYLRDSVPAFDAVGFFIQSDLAVIQMEKRARYLTKEGAFPYGGSNVYQLACNGERLPFADNSVDILFLMEAIEHFELPHQGIFEFARVLKPGGRVLITTPRASALFYFLFQHRRRNRGYYSPHPWPDYSISDENFWKFIFEADLIEVKCRFFNVQIPKLTGLVGLLPGPLRKA
jgi:SAM-dependent methyltransferase/uncharacterized protein YbaR (Trm112 family)